MLEIVFQFLLCYNLFKEVIPWIIAIDVSDSTVGHWEKKRRHMTIDCLIKLCKYYNVSADFILGFSDTPIQLTDLNVDTSMETSQQKKSS